MSVIDNRTQLLNQALAIASSLAGVVAQTEDPGLIQLAANVSNRVSRLTLDSDPDEVRAAISMLGTCDFAMQRLAKAAAEDDIVDA